MPAVEISAKMAMTMSNSTNVNPFSLPAFFIRNSTFPSTARRHRDYQLIYRLHPRKGSFPRPPPGRIFKITHFLSIA
jgi:hypothetical protein